jgi:acetoin utilization protein AcuB
MLVKDFMTAQVQTIAEDKTMLEARELMSAKGVHRLPVVDDIKRIMGIITDDDIGSASPSDVSTLSRYEANYLLSRLKVRDIMTKTVMTVRDNVGVEDAAYLLYKYKITGLPVVDEENKLVGIISSHDIFRAFVGVMGLSKGSTRITIDTQDKVGVIADIAGMFRDLGINIISIVTQLESEAHTEITIRADLSQHGMEIIEQIREAGYTVSDISTIKDLA